MPHPEPKDKPPYRRIIENVVARIARGEWPAGDPLPTRTELAQEFGAARATVDKALAELVREGVLEAGSGRRTTVAAIPPRPAVTSIAVLWDWTPDQERQGGEYLDRLFRGVRGACAEYHLNVHFRRAPFHAAREVLDSTGAQGLLAIRPEYADERAIDALVARGTPVVAAPSILEACSAPCVAADNRGGVEEAVVHLVELGHREIGFLDLTATIPDHFERLRAFLAATGAQGLPMRPEWLLVSHETGPATFSDAIGGWLESSHPTAILAGDFLMALALLRRLGALGLRVPEDVSLVAFDDPPAASGLEPPLTTVAQPVERIGFRAVERLVELVAGREVPRHERLPARLVVRASTRDRSSPALSR